MTLIAAPQVELLAVGTEVAWGETVNTNAAWLAQACRALGWVPAWHSVVMDDDQAIAEAVVHAQQRADWLIVTGGLGPTPDDRTVAALAGALNTPLVQEPAVLAHLEQYFRQLQRSMPASNHRQALIPQGSQALLNPAGTAPGVVWHLPAQTGRRLQGVVLLPGVPREVYALWPGVQKALGLQTEASAPVHQDWPMLWCFGLGESEIFARLEQTDKGMDLLQQVRIDSYVSDDGLIRLRMSPQVSGLDAPAVLDTVQALLKPHAYACAQGSTPVLLETQVGELLQHRQETLAVAESCTGGLVSHRLTNKAGSSAFTRLNVVTYSNAWKATLLHVPESILQAHGAVSRKTVEAMAQGVAQLAGTDWGLATSGIAGPGGGTSAKPVGLLCVGGYYAPTQQHWSQSLYLPAHLDRMAMKQRFANWALFSLWQALQDQVQQPFAHAL